MIAGADVLIVNDATAVQYPGKTNSEGYYVVPNIPPGTYRIQVSNSGFKTIIKPDIVIHVEDALAINFTLPIGAASEIVTVEGGAPIINTENASVGTVIDRNFVESLPLNGRSFNTLLQLTPGVVIAPIDSASSTDNSALRGRELTQIVFRSTVCRPISALLRRWGWDSQEQERHKRLALSEAQAVWSPWMRCKSSELRLLRLPRSLGDLLVDK